MTDSNAASTPSCAHPSGMIVVVPGHNVLFNPKWVPAESGRGQNLGWCAHSTADGLVAPDGWDIELSPYRAGWHALICLRGPHPQHVVRVAVSSSNLNELATWAVQTLLRLQEGILPRLYAVPFPLLSTEDL